MRQLKAIFSIWIGSLFYFPSPTFAVFEDLLRQVQKTSYDALSIEEIQKIADWGTFIQQLQAEEKKGWISAKNVLAFLGTANRLLQSPPTSLFREREGITLFQFFSKAFKKAYPPGRIRLLIQQSPDFFQQMANFEKHVLDRVKNLHHTNTPASFLAFWEQFAFLTTFLDTVPLDRAPLVSIETEWIQAAHQELMQKQALFQPQDWISFFRIHAQLRVQVPASFLKEVESKIRQPDFFSNAFLAKLFFLQARLGLGLEKAGFLQNSEWISLWKDRIHQMSSKNKIHESLRKIQGFLSLESYGALFYGFALMEIQRPGFLAQGKELVFQLLTQLNSYLSRGSWPHASVAHQLFLGIQFFQTLEEFPSSQRELLKTLQEKLVNQYESVWKNQPVTISYLQKQVLLLLSDLQEENNFIPQDPILSEHWNSFLQSSVDLVLGGDKPLWIQVDGPSHFWRGTDVLLPTSEFQSRLIQSQGERWLRIPYFKMVNLADHSSVSEPLGGQQAFFETFLQTFFKDPKASEKSSFAQVKQERKKLSWQELLEELKQGQFRRYKYLNRFLKEDPEGLYQLGRLFLQENGPLSLDYEKAFFYLNQAAQKKHPRAFYLCARVLFEMNRFRFPSLKKEIKKKIQEFLNQGTLSADPRAFLADGHFQAVWSGMSDLMHFFICLPSFQIGNLSDSLSKVNPIYFEKLKKSTSLKEEFERDLTKHNEDDFQEYPAFLLFRGAMESFFLPNAEEHLSEALLESAERGCEKALILILERYFSFLDQNHKNFDFFKKMSPSETERFEQILDFFLFEKGSLELARELTEFFLVHAYYYHNKRWVFDHDSYQNSIHRLNRYKRILEALLNQIESSSDGDVDLKKDNRRDVVMRLSDICFLIEGLNPNEATHREFETFEKEALKEGHMNSVLRFLTQNIASLSHPSDVEPFIAEVLPVLKSIRKNPGIQSVYPLLVELKHHPLLKTSHLFHVKTEFGALLFSYLNAYYMQEAKANQGKDGGYWYCELGDLFFSLSNDLKLAEEFWKKASEQGNARASEVLGRLYESGLNLTDSHGNQNRILKNLVKARHFKALAEKQDRIK